MAFQLFPEVVKQHETQWLQDEDRDRTIPPDMHTAGSPEAPELTAAAAYFVGEGVTLGGLMVYVP